MMKQERASILYIHLGLTTFVRKDMEILESTFRLVPYAFSMSRKAYLPFRLVHQLGFLLAHIWSTKLIVCQFAGYHGVLPGLLGRLTGKKMLIVASGTESASYPSIRYGNYHKRLYRMFTRWSFRLCHHIAPVHERLIRWDNHYYEQDGTAQGIYAHVPGLKRPYTVIPYGYDCAKWSAPTAPKEPHTGITIAFIPDKVRYELKGIDLLIQAAASLPEMQFTIVGMSYRPEEEIPENVHILGPTPHEELQALLETHTFYFQLSISEGFPNALCEGMLKNCVPVGSAVTSIPEIVGDTGFILAQRSVPLLVQLLQEAQTSACQILGASARNRICERYTLQNRTERLIDLAQMLMDETYA